MNVKVSVLMPVYNGELYLREAMESILGQTYADFEFIIINDGSTDASESIIESYEDKRIKYYKNSENLGLIKTLNKGIDLCSAPYIARMDADDISAENRLKEQVMFLDENGDYILCGTDAIVIDSKSAEIGKIRNFSDSELLKIHLLFSVPFIHPSTMIRRVALENNKYDISYKHVEDYELWTRLSDYGKMTNINKDLFRYRWHDSNVSVGNADYQKRKKEDVQKQLLANLGIDNPSEMDLYYHQLSFNIYELGNKKVGVKLDLKGAENWFERLTVQNGLTKIYNQNKFIAYLWARWIILCLAQKNYGKIISPRFASYKPSIISQLVKILIDFKRKK